MAHLIALPAAGTVFNSAHGNSPLFAPSRFSLVTKLTGEVGHDEAIGGYMGEGTNTPW